MLGNRPDERPGVVDRALFRPETIPPGAVMAIALAPSVAAGILLFRERAALIAAVAVAIGGSIGLIARLARMPGGGAALTNAVIGAALCGPLAAPGWPAGIALTAAITELLRARFWPTSRISTGLLAYAAAYLAGSGVVAAYARPSAPGLMFPEPIQQWSRFYGGAARFLDPVTLYVGNVAGPALCTSLLAVAIGAAWLWYARRLSLISLAGFLVTGTAMSLALHWDPVFQLDSGPAWFVVGFTLADRKLLPSEPRSRPVLAAATGVIALGLRATNLYIEALPLVAVALQLVFSGVEAAAGAMTPRLLPGGRRVIGRRPAETEPVSG